MCSVENPWWAPTVSNPPVSLSAVCQWTSAQEGKTALNFLNIQDNQRVVIVNFIFEEIERQAKRAGKSG